MKDVVGQQKDVMGNIDMDHLDDLREEMEDLKY